MPSHVSFRRRGLIATAAALALSVPSTVAAQEALARGSKQVPQGGLAQATSEYGPTGIEFVLATDATLIDGTSAPAGTSLHRCTDQASINNCVYQFDFEPGTVVNVVYTYPTHTSTVPVTVVERDPVGQSEDAPLVNEEFISGEYSIKYPKSFARIGDKGTSLAPTATRVVDGVRYENQPLPKGTTFAVDEKSADVAEVDELGRVTLTSPATAKPGETVSVGVIATYPDGSKGTFTATFQLENKLQEDMFTPHYEEGREVVPGGTITVRQVAGDLPKDVLFDPHTPAKDLNGWTVSVDAATGDLSVTAPKGGEHQPLRFTTAALYADGSQSKFTAEVSLKDGKAESGEHRVSFPEVSAATGDGDVLSVTPSIPKELPEGTRFTLVKAGSLKGAEVNEKTGELTFTGATGGTEPVDPVVQVTYPDGSVSTVEIPLDVTGNDGDRICAVKASSTSSAKECTAAIIGVLAVVTGIIGMFTGAARVLQDYLPEQLRPYLPKGW